MKVIIAAAVLAALGAGAAFAQADVIKARQEAMKAAGAATGPVGKMLKGEEAFDLAKVQAALRAYSDTAKKSAALYPDNSKTGGDTAALPAVWEKKADFTAKFEAWDKEAAAALASIKDEASFKATFPNVLKNCGGCHETYRAKKS
ncbi:MAG: cytochrome c [Methylobacteriaceae bacterium]|nr:cytochrome c [Methylobacteriaceae bacterium]